MTMDSDALGMGAADGPSVLGPARPLDPEEVRAIVEQEIQNSIGALSGSGISEDRRRSLRMYDGRPLGNEVKDRSQVVMRDVLETIEWTMPSLMRMFSGDIIARFRPQKKTPEAQHQADLATAYCNKVFLEDNEGEEILYSGFKTGLMEKNGIWKVSYQQKRTMCKETYTGLTEEELLVISDRDGFQPIAVDERVAMIDGVEVKLFDLEAKFWKVENRVVVESIPPEEFLYARRMIRLDDDSPFTAHRKKYTVSDLVSMGFDFEELQDIPADDAPEFTEARVTRHEGDTYPIGLGERQDKASRELWTTECHLPIDEDGDGYAELRKILVVGESSVVVLEDEEENWNPFVSITPIPMPHTFTGNSLSDLVMDLQVIRSTLIRQILDHTYLAVTPRHAVVEGMVELEDLLTTRPGGVVRVRAPGMIENLELPQLPGHVFELFKHLQDVRQDRTGVIAHGAELDASAINSTATGWNGMMAERQQKIEMIARVYSWGVKKLFKKILRCAVENDTKEQQVELNGEWITVNPSEWDADMSVEVEVGLGAGQAAERLQNLQVLAAMIERVMQSRFGYLFDASHIHELFKRLTETIGFRNTSLFIGSPEGRQPPDPPPDPDIEKIRADVQKAAADQESKQRELELAILKEKNIVSHRSEELRTKERIERAQIESNERIAIQRELAMIEVAEIQARAQREREAAKQQESSADKGGGGE